jgi:ornithine cyclodeaminase/alanine dehydrogenase-like protein (mu-crystallin family)
MAEAVDAVEKAFADWGAHAEINLTRRRLHFGNARLNTMPAAMPSRGKIGVRLQAEILAVIDNVQTYPARSPLVDILFDLATAAPVAMILASTKRGLTTDGVPLRTSDLMTAAISAVGTKWMSRDDARRLLVLGSGKQARSHLLAMKAIRKFQQVMVYSPNPQHRSVFAAEMRGALDLDIRAVDDVRSAMQEADIVVTATNTNVPVFSGGFLRSGMHVTSIVGSNVGMIHSGVIASKRRELDDLTLERAGIIGIASRELAIQDEQGDIFDQVASGKLCWDDIAELREIVAGDKLGRRSAEDITVFKNNGGQGIAELAIGDLILHRARQRKLGIEVSWPDGY